MNESINKYKSVNRAVRKLKCIKGKAVELNEGTSEKSSYWEECLLFKNVINTRELLPPSSASLLHYGNASLRPHLSGFLLQMKLTWREFITMHLLRQRKPCCKSGSTAWWMLPEEARTNTWQIKLHRQKGSQVTVSASFSCSWTSWQQAGDLGGWYDSYRGFAGNMLQQDRNHRVQLDQVLSWMQEGHESYI